MTEETIHAAVLGTGAIESLPVHPHLARELCTVGRLLCTVGYVLCAEAVYCVLWAVCLGLVLCA